MPLEEMIRNLHVLDWEGIADVIILQFPFFTGLTIRRRTEKVISLTTNAVRPAECFQFLFPIWSICSLLDLQHEF